MNLEVDLLQDVISLSDLKDNPNAVIEDVQNRRVTKIVTKRGKPTAVIVNLEDYLQLKQALVQAEAREIAQLHQSFVEAGKLDKLGTSEDLWSLFGLTPPTTPGPAGRGRLDEAAS